MGMFAEGVRWSLGEGVEERVEDEEVECWVANLIYRVCLSPSRPVLLLPFPLFPPTPFPSFISLIPTQKHPEKIQDPQAPKPPKATPTPPPLLSISATSKLTNHHLPTTGSPKRLHLPRTQHRSPQPQRRGVPRHRRMKKPIMPRTHNPSYTYLPCLPSLA